MTAPQQITEDLRAWIISQAQAGCRPDDVLAAMRASGWEEETAMKALESTLSNHLVEHAKKNGLPPPVVVPAPDLLDSPTRITVGSREIAVLSTMLSPRVVVFGSFLDDAECEALRALAAPRLARSETVINTTGGSEVNEARTSDGMFFSRGETPLIQSIEERIAALLNWPVENGEGLQILRYRPGAQYKPHHDYFDPAHTGTPSILKRGGQRVGTLIMYLNTPKRGGATTFPDVGLEVGPVQGNAVFFSYDRPHVMTRTLHGGAPVLEGEKWVATKWLREGVFT